VNTVTATVILLTLTTVSSSRCPICARRAEYGLNGYFDRFPTVIYYEPTDSDMRYMTVASAGVPYAGLVSLNDAGIFLGAHIIPSRASSVCGVSALLIATHVIRTARTFDEAVAVFNTMRPPTGWVYTLVSCNEGRVGSVELNNQRVKVYEYRNDYGTALRLLNQAIKLDGQNAAYHFVAAIMALKAGCHSYATSALQESLELESSPYRRLLAHYYLGRVYALLGSRKAARAKFGLVASSSQSGPKLRAAASDSYRKTRRLRRHRLRPKSLRIVFQFADMLEY
jgi:tetratricopeptide (TPR) repeat protein